MFDLRGQLASAGGELGHDLLVQPDIHAGGIIGVAGIAQLLGKFLSCGEARIYVERLHKVDNRSPPFQLLMFCRDGFIQNRRHIHGLCRC